MSDSLQPHGLYSPGNAPGQNTGVGTETEAPGLWPRYVKYQLIGRDPDAGRDWGQEEKGTPWSWDGPLETPLGLVQ